MNLKMNIRSLNSCSTDLSKIFIENSFILLLATYLLCPCLLHAGSLNQIPGLTTIVNLAEEPSGYRIQQRLEALLTPYDAKSLNRLLKAGIPQDVAEDLIARWQLESFIDGREIPMEVGTISGAVRAYGNQDPWASFRYAYTNETEVPIEFFFALNMPIQRIGGQIFLESYLDIQVFDTDKNNEASFTSVFANNRLNVLDIDFGPGGGVIQANVELPGSGDINDIFASDGLVKAIDEPLSLFDLAAELEDSGAETVEDANFWVGGILSAGDSFIIDGFSCFSNSSEFCPEELREVYSYSPVPLPPAIWLFGSALLGGLVGLRRKTQAKQLS